ncbi:MAG: SDR family oxidoreductase [Pirellulaceae bacterium]
MMGLTDRFRELASPGVTVNAVAPGFIASEMTAAVGCGWWMEKQFPPNASAEPDVAAAVLFLASRSGRLCNGAMSGG